MPYGACVECGNAFEECSGHSERPPRVVRKRREQRKINAEGAKGVLERLLEIETRQHGKGA